MPNATKVFKIIGKSDNLSIFENFRYTVGIVHYAKMLNNTFPGWKLILYIPPKMMTQSNVKMKIPKHIFNQLEQLQAEFR